MVISTQNWSILAQFAKRNPAKSLFFTDCFLAKFLPEISREIGQFFCEFWLSPVNIPRNRPIFPRIWPWKSREILLFLPRNIRSPAKPSLISRIDYNPSVIWISPKNFTCPLGKLRTKITSPIAKSSSPGLSDMTFFACCVAQLKSQTFNFSH